MPCAGNGKQLDRTQLALTGVVVAGLKCPFVGRWASASAQADQAIRASVPGRAVADWIRFMSPGDDRSDEVGGAYRDALA